MARCLDCEHLHQVEGKELFFCLKTRDYIQHDVDEEVRCDGFKKLPNKK